jgi:hypothetical protein
MQEYMQEKVKKEKERIKGMGSRLKRREER